MFRQNTNILSELVKKKPNSYLLSRLSSLPIHTLFTSIICLMELRNGSAPRADLDSFWSKIVEQVISQVQVISLGPEGELIAGDLLARLRKKGQSIGLEDILISSTAIAHNLVLITANIKHFSKIDGLTVENWLVV